MDTEVRLMHSRNARSPIVVTELGIVIESSPVQPAKVPFPIVLTELGINTDFSSEQPENA